MPALFGYGSLRCPLLCVKCYWLICNQKIVKTFKPNSRRISWRKVQKEPMSPPPTSPSNDTVWYPYLSEDLLMLPPQPVVSAGRLLPHPVLYLVLSLLLLQSATFGTSGSCFPVGPPRLAEPYFGGRTAAICTVSSECLNIQSLN